MLLRVIEGLGSGQLRGGGVRCPRTPATGYGQPGNDDLRSLIRSVIEETASAGKGGHRRPRRLTRAGRPPGCPACPDHGLTEPTRERRLAAAARDRFSARPAKVIKKGDAARADYIQRFYGVSAEVPTQYDLVINTDKLGTAGGGPPDRSGRRRPRRLTRRARAGC